MKNQYTILIVATMCILSTSAVAMFLSPKAQQRTEQRRQRQAHIRMLPTNVDDITPTFLNQRNTIVLDMLHKADTIPFKTLEMEKNFIWRCMEIAHKAKDQTFYAADLAKVSNDLSKIYATIAAIYAYKDLGIHLTTDEFGNNLYEVAIANTKYPSILFNLLWNNQNLPQTTFDDALKAHMKLALMHFWSNPYYSDFIKDRSVFCKHDPMHFANIVTAYLNNHKESVSKRADAARDMIRMYTLMVEVNAREIEARCKNKLLIIRP